MKVGILTFHSQLNYGGVLQCWALQTALERIGHDVVILDRRLYPEPTMFDGIMYRWSFASWAKVILRGLLMSGGFAFLMRCIATKKFLHQRLHLSPFHFYDWKDSPKDLGVDIVVVGSDQVWHCGDWGDPRPYLMEGAPPIPAIAYAASFGMEQLPKFIACRNDEDSSNDISESAITVFKQGLSRFSAISCREAEGGRICKDLGEEAVHVVDPTLLAWNLGGDVVKVRRLVCYLMGGDVESYWNALEDFAQRRDCEVYMFTNSPFLQLPRTISSFLKLPRRVYRKYFSRVKLMNAAGPQEFVDAFKGASWVISDSFHALMFSILNGCNVRIVKPSGDMRARMFARITEIVSHMQGEVLASSVADALESFNRNETVSIDAKWLKEWKEKSWEWLSDNVESAALSKTVIKGCS